MKARIAQICASYIVMEIFQNERLVGQYNVSYGKVHHSNIHVGQEYSVVEKDGEMDFWL